MIIMTSLEIPEMETSLNIGAGTKVELYGDQFLSILTLITMRKHSNLLLI